MSSEAAEIAKTLCLQLIGEIERRQRVEMLRNQLQRSVCDELGGLRDAIQTLDRLAESAPDHQHEIDRARRAVSMAFSALTEAVDRCWDEGEQ